MKFHTLGIEETLHQLDTHHSGLSRKAVRLRREQHGRNVLPAEPLPAWWTVLAEQFKSPLVYILLGAAFVSLLLGDSIDATIIVGAVFIQVSVGFIQEFKAQQSLAALKRVVSLQARVQREHKEIVLAAEELVPGDIVLLQAGDKIPADVRLIETTEFEVNEAALTGESEPVAKDHHTIHPADAPIGDRTNLAFTGTVATKGSAVGVVIEIGNNTEIGKIAQLIKDTTEDYTPLQKQLMQFARSVSLGVIVIALGIFAFGYFSTGNLREIFTVAIAVAVSAIPEGLAIAVTIILAAGMRRILHRRGLVRKLVAAETLGSTNVICTDKTGTLTEGKMQVTDVVTWESDFAVDGKDHTADAGARDLVFALRLGLLCNDAKVNNPEDTIAQWIISGNLTERALLLAASQAGLHLQKTIKAAPRLDTIPFTSTIKYMATLHREPHGRMLYMKGAPEIVTAMCSEVMISGEGIKFDNDKREQFQNKFLALSKKGLRIIALAYKPTTQRTIQAAGLADLILVGYIGIKDPLRAEAKRTVAECRTAGIQTIMITGDHKLTAQAIAHELGIDCTAENIMEGKELDQLSQHDLNKRVKDITVYARVTPEHKLRIIQAWQANHMVVAMTGDGINDAPALKAADIGVALGSGTDVAKETADLVILDDNFSTIVAAVEEGRGIFDNIKKVVLYLLSDSFSEVILIVGSLLLGLPIPITAAQILWINIVNDSFPSLAMTQEPKEPESMREPARGHNTTILDREIKFFMVVITILTGLANLALFCYIYTTTGDLLLARTMIFLSFGLDSLMFMFSIRSLRRMMYKTRLLANPWLLLALGVGIVAQIIPIYTPWLQPYFGTVALGWPAWGIVIGLIMLELIIIEICKYIYLRYNRAL